MIMIDVEINVHINEICSIYKTLINENLLIYLNENDISLITTKNPSSPYPKLVLTPFSIIQYFIQQINGKNIEFHSQFKNIFKVFSDEFDEIHLKEEGYNEMNNLIEKIGNNNSIYEIIEKNEYFEKIKHVLDLPSFSL